MINILISVNKEYLDKSETMLHSLRRNNHEDITVYLMNHCLNVNQVNKFKRYLSKHLKMNLEVLDVRTSVFDQLPLGDERFSREIYYRVLAQFLLPENVDRIIWLDADIIFCGNISEFYHQDFNGKLLAVCPDGDCNKKDIIQIKENLGLSKEHIYFNSGVLLLNIEELKKKTNLDEIVQTAKNISKFFKFPDQDLLNYIYSNQVKYCNQNKYNCQVKNYGKLTKEQINDIIILHYAGNQKPWKFYYIKELSRTVIPYWKEVFLQGRWVSIGKVIFLYVVWLIYYKTGICNIVRKKMVKKSESSQNNRIK